MRAARPRRVVDAVADDGPVAGVDQLREDRVHHVVVERPAAAGLVRLALRARRARSRGTSPARRTACRGRRRGSRRAPARSAGGAVLVRRPVGLAVEPVPEGEVGVQPRAVRTLVAVRRGGTRPPCCRGRGSRGRGSPDRTASAPSIMFFTSGRPTRSIRTLSLPRVSVSATTPTSAAPPSSARSRSRRRGRGRSCRRGRSSPGSVNASSPVAIVFSAAGASMMNGSQRGPAKTRTPCPSRPARRSTAERDGLARRSACRCRPARSRAVALQGGEDAVEDELLVADRRTAPGRPARAAVERAQPEAVDEPVGEQRPTAARTAACSSPARDAPAARDSGTRTRR